MRLFPSFSFLLSFLPPPFTFLFPSDREIFEVGVCCRQILWQPEKWVPSPLLPLFSPPSLFCFGRHFFCRKQGRGGTQEREEVMRRFPSSSFSLPCLSEDLDGAGQRQRGRRAASNEEWASFSLPPPFFCSGRTSPSAAKQWATAFKQVR